METLGVIFEFEDFCGGEKSEDFCDFFWFFFFAVRVFFHCLRL